MILRNVVNDDGWKDFCDDAGVERGWYMWFNGFLPRSLQIYPAAFADIVAQTYHIRESKKNIIDINAHEIGHLLMGPEHTPWYHFTIMSATRLTGFIDYWGLRLEAKRFVEKE